jgi:hypothetical protein
MDVSRGIAATIQRYGLPEHIRSDNGPEFIAYALQDWLWEQAIKVIYITPGSLWENGHIESFHDKFRDECLNWELFGSLTEARIIIESWRAEYNTERPHISLGNQTPVEFAARDLEGSRLRSGSALPLSRTFSRKNNNRQPWNSTFDVSTFWGQVNCTALYAVKIKAFLSLFTLDRSGVRCVGKRH